MSVLAYFSGGILPYVTALIFVAGLAWKIDYWASAPKHLHWELFPYPHTVGAQLAEMVKEVATLHSLYLYKRKIWGPSLLMHWGIYLVILWFLLVLAGFAHASYAGVAGATMAATGAVLLGAYRLMDASVRNISSFPEYFNLAVILAISACGLATGFFAQGVLLREYVSSLVIFSPRVPTAPGILVNLILIQFFCIYLPFSRLTHFVAKYFTYHKVKWGEIK
ncbi:nitrate reductase [Clostridiales bacterium PH28_bin88]|nr:nitrate reductase [Clostridiales bacterium PH28_bin88]